MNDDRTGASPVDQPVKALPPKRADAPDEMPTPGSCNVPPIEERRRLFKLAEENAKKVLKPGDRVRVTKCPGTKRWITFAGWDGHWMVSKSGINDYSPGAVDMVNGEPVDFTAVEQRERHNA